MNLILRILVGAGLFTFGYYLGREVTRSEFIQDRLDDSPPRRAQGPSLEPDNTD